MKLFKARTVETSKKKPEKRPRSKCRGKLTFTGFVEGQPLSCLIDGELLYF